MLIQLPLPESNPFDEPLICAKVNREWMSFVVGALSEWKASQAFAGNTPQDDIDQRKRISALEILLAQASAENCATMPELQHQTVRAVHHTDQGVNGGTTVINTWTQLPITAIFDDNSGNGEVDGNELYLDPSTMWKITAWHVFRSNLAGIARFRLVANSYHYSNPILIPASSSGLCIVSAMVSTSVLEWMTWEYLVTQTQTNTGLGHPQNSAGINEIYGEIFAERIILNP